MIRGIGERSVISDEAKQNKAILQAQLESYAAKGLYPFHMPGHKRRLAPAPDLPYTWDVTEVEGLDDLHHADGILQQAMRRTALLCGARRTWYLVGGSTTGILAAVRAAAPGGSEIIAARNCHKSVYHAVELGDLDVHWLFPETDPDWQINGSIRPEDVQDALEQHPHAAAVIVTSPTYEGVLSDIRGIAGICHAAGVPLIVDEAHGAHLGLFPGTVFPDSSVHLGADIVIQSAHKTLPSLTQTALLHWNSALIAQEEIAHQLDVFETSSPSYPLLASLDGCTGILTSGGRELFQDWQERLAHFHEAALALRHVHVLCYGKDRAKPHPAIHVSDPGKLLVRADGMRGRELADWVREDFRIETEMHCGRNVLFMTSCCDTDEGFERLIRALRELDRKLSVPLKHPCGGKTVREEEAAAAAPDSGKAPESRGYSASIGAKIPGLREITGTKRTGIASALRSPSSEVLLAEAPGRISAEYVMAYPPGIPILVPGEEITEGEVQELFRLSREGANLIRSGGSGTETCRVLKS